MDQKNNSPLLELIRFVILTLLIVIPIRVYIAQPFIVSGASMDPTFRNGDYLIVDELSYHLRAPKRGEVVVFRYPKEPAKYFIKRVIGLPGETLEIKASEISVTKDNETTTLTEPYVAQATEPDLKINLASHDYFVMGDNRGASFDSRSWGPVAANLIKGRALIRVFPLNKIGILPGLARE